MTNNQATDDLKHPQAPPGYGPPLCICDDPSCQVRLERLAWEMWRKAIILAFEPESTRRQNKEDYRAQIEAAQLSMERGYYATARTELRGAILILQAMERYDAE